MSKLTALCGKVKEDLVIKNDDGTEVVITLKAPKVEDLAEISELFANKGETDKINKEQMNTIMLLAKKMIKEAVPDATDDEINEVVLKNLDLVVNAIINLFNKSFGVVEKK